MAKSAAGVSRQRLHEPEADDYAPWFSMMML
jgi:hypothetical protein